MMQIDPPVVEEVEGSSGVANGALQQLPVLPRLRRLELRIPATKASIEERKGWRVLCGVGRLDLCAQIGEGVPPFIAGGRGRGHGSVDDQDGVTGRERDGRACHRVHGVTAFVTGVLEQRTVV